MRSRGGCPGHSSILISNLASLSYYVSALVGHKLLSKMFALRSVSMAIIRPARNRYIPWL